MLPSIQQEFSNLLNEFLERYPLTEKHLLVVGCSTSEVIGKKIGTAGSQEVATQLWQALQEAQAKHHFNIAVQCCEHLNRTLVIERNILEQRNFREVFAVPAPHAGGSFAAHVYRQLQAPCLAEEVVGDAGFDIGDTFIAQHLRSVVVPVRLSQKNIGEAHFTAAITRAPLIGGYRAVYEL